MWLAFPGDCLNGHCFNRAHEATFGSSGSHMSCSRDMCAVSAMKGSMRESRPHPQCGPHTILLIYHKWSFQWQAGKFPIHQIISKWHPFNSFPVKLGVFEKAFPVSLWCNKYHVNGMVKLGVFSTGNTCSWPDMASPSFILVESLRTEKRMEIQWLQTSG